MGLLLGCEPNENSPIIVSLKGIVRTPLGIILVQRSSDASVYPNYWEIPGGKFSGGFLSTNLKRELREELGEGIRGAKIGGLQCVFVHLEHINQGKNAGKVASFIYVLVEKEKKDLRISLDFKEYQKWKWVKSNTSLTDLLLRPFTKEVLQVVFEKYS